MHDYYAIIGIETGACLYLVPQEHQVPIMMKFAKLHPSDVDIVRIRTIDELGSIMAKNLERLILNLQAEYGATKDA